MRLRRRFDRIRCAIHVLRGRPLIYEANLVGIAIGENEHLLMYGGVIDGKGRVTLCFGDWPSYKK